MSQRLRDFYDVRSPGFGRHYNGGVCTMTWQWRADGYEVFFNRDELRSRHAASPPTERVRHGVRYVAPTDGESGGTWLAANELGVTVCLLNGYAAGDPVPDRPIESYTSRGILVAELADCASLDAIARRLADRDLQEFRAFWLVALAPGRAGLLARWIDGRLESGPLGDDAMPLVSSSFETEAVRRARTALFRDGERIADVSGHLAYHASHLPQPGPYSVCMHRPDAQTVSFSHVTVDPRRVHFRYSPHPPHEGLPAGPDVTLARREHGVRVP